jgi:hypothetical protein
MTKTDVANIALTELGIDLIQSLDNSSTEARYCKRFIDIASRLVLAEAEWEPVVEVADLVEDTDYTNDSEYTYVFDLPDDFLFPLSVNYVETTDFIIEDGHLFTNEKEVALRYVEGAVDEDSGSVLYPDWAALAIGYRLAMMVAPKLAPDRRGNAEVSYARAIVEAKAANASVRRPRQGDNPWWTD